MPRALFNKGLFAGSLVATSLTAATSVGGSVLYTTLYLSAFVALVPGDEQDSQLFWNEHAAKNMFTVFVCVEMLVSRAWALYECLRVLRTEALGSAIEQRRWALASMWTAVAVALLLDGLTHYFIYTKSQRCDDVETLEPRTQRTFARLCAQSTHNQNLIDGLHYGNLALMLLSACLTTADTVQQSKEIDASTRTVLDDFLDFKGLDPKQNERKED